MPNAFVLDRSLFKAYVDKFNAYDDERVVNHIDNRSAWPWLEHTIPFFECPDKEIEETYDFRWWTYRKHITATPDGFVVTEFLPPVPWSKKHNTIACAAGHHFYEGRWLHNPQYLDEYALFWFRRGGEPRNYSLWAADALYARYLVNQDKEFITGLLPDLAANYQAWEESHRDPVGLFWQVDDRDGMEYTVSGLSDRPVSGPMGADEFYGGSGQEIVKQYRPTINSYMYGDAAAIAKIAGLAGQDDLAHCYQAKAAQIKELVESRLWNAEDGFFETLPRHASQHIRVREQIGFIPWYFNLPAPGYEAAWKQLMDLQGFYAPFGPTTVERRHPRFGYPVDHECLWNGPAWPFATTQTLVALVNLLNAYRQEYVSRADYLRLLKIYAGSQRRRLENGTVVPWIDEDLNPDTGEWIARQILYQWGRADKDRGRDYNHSGYCDSIISGLVGLRPHEDDMVEVNPLVPPETWPYFCLDQVLYHGHELTILYDKTGQRYHHGPGLRLFADGQEIASASHLGRIAGRLPARASSPAPAPRSRGTRAGWQKFPGNPVLGGDLGTCFDVSVLKEGDIYRMWFSWRPRKSVALTESRDGVHWSEPVIALGPNLATGWEDDINRPGVIKHAGIYHMWYTGQLKPGLPDGRSWIGYATSRDGITWERASAQPVLSAAEEWEKVALMCPHILWDEQDKLFKMWYSGGEQYEPNAIGYATSPDGLTWTKLAANPIFRADPNTPWEQHKVAACQVLRRDGWYLMFYIGYHDEHYAQIGIARSRDGITGWERHPANPVIAPDEGRWDGEACYKPYALFDGQKWLLWYNGRTGSVEQIGLATHLGEDLGF